MLSVRSVADLNAALVDGLHRVPRTIDAVVGIPRSGLLPATMVALHLQKPLADVDGVCHDRVWRRFHAPAPPPGRILLLDDSINKGRAMTWAVAQIRQAKPRLHIIRAAVFTAPHTPDGLVDVAFAECPTPRVFAWNLWKHIRLPRWGFDFDGVFCRDPIAAENDDGPRYRTFLETVEPRFLPTRPIGHIVTCRLERYRALTEGWLQRHGIQYAALHMLDLPDKQARKEQGGRGAWKAAIARDLGVELFIESNAGQAAKIAHLAGLPVWCTTTQTVMAPEAR